jgi:hypothetical protein
MKKKQRGFGGVVVLATEVSRHNGGQTGALGSIRSANGGLPQPF